MVREILGVSEVVDLTLVGQTEFEAISARVVTSVRRGLLVRINASEKSVGLTPDQARHFARCLNKLARAAENGE